METKNVFESVSIRKSELKVCARFIRRGDPVLALRILYGMLLHDNRKAKVTDIYRTALFIRNELASELENEKCTIESAATLVRWLVDHMVYRESENLDPDLSDLGVSFDVNSEI